MLQSSLCDVSQPNPSTLPQPTLGKKKHQAIRAFWKTKRWVLLDPRGIIFYKVGQPWKRHASKIPLYDSTSGKEPGTYPHYLIWRMGRYSQGKVIFQITWPCPCRALKTLTFGSKMCWYINASYIFICKTVEEKKHASFWNNGKCVYLSMCPHPLDISMQEEITFTDLNICRSLSISALKIKLISITLIYRENSWKFTSLD